MNFRPGEKVLLEWKGYSEEVEHWGESPFVKNSIVVKGKDGVMRTESLNAVYITPVSKATQQRGVFEMADKLITPELIEGYCNRLVSQDIFTLNDEVGAILRDFQAKVLKHGLDRPELEKEIREQEQVKATKYYAETLGQVIDKERKQAKREERERIKKIYASFGKIQPEKPLSDEEFLALFD